VVALPAGARKSIFNISKLRWLSLLKPPPSLALSCGRFDASTSSATTSSTTTSTSINVVRKYRLMKIDFRAADGGGLDSFGNLCYG